MDKKYNGWTNRETWVLKMHIDNFDAGCEPKYDPKIVSVGELANFLKTLHEELFQLVYDGKCPQEDVILMVKDVGSLWRVDFDEIATALLDERKEVKNE